MFVARFVAAAFGMVAEHATLLRNKVVQQKSGVSSALNHRSHGPNLVRVPCETKENEQASLRLTPGQV